MRKQHSSPPEASAAQSLFGRLYTTRVTTDGGTLRAAAASARRAFEMLAIVSIQIAVGCRYAARSFSRAHGDGTSDERKASLCVARRKAASLSTSTYHDVEEPLKGLMNSGGWAGLGGDAGGLGIAGGSVGAGVAGGPGGTAGAHIGHAMHFQLLEQAVGVHHPAHMLATRPMNKTCTCRMPGKPINISAHNQTV